MDVSVGKWWQFSGVPGACPISRTNVPVLPAAVPVGVRSGAPEPAATPKRNNVHSGNVAMAVRPENAFFCFANALLY